MGWCGLKYIAARNEVDLGYRFKQASWGKGYAAEAAFACIKHGFEKLNLARIIGRSVPANAGSLRVLEKCGMQFIEEEIVDGYPARAYELINLFIH